MLSEFFLTNTREEPFPGLRCFEQKEELLFFGRNADTRALLERFAKSRFLAVVGPSGSGKSSLVRAGLIPNLIRGNLSGASTRWRIAIMRPGNAPFDSLAAALAEPTALGGTRDTWRAQLGRTSFGIRDIARSVQLDASENLLIVVDQFEELIRYRSEGSTQESSDAILFVSSLLQAAEEFRGRVYVVLTMRSDYLGDCDAFPGLPEALNQCQYLIPRMTRDQRREAIEGPLRLAGVPIKSWLVERMLNDAGDNPDQLPVLQHAVSQTYRGYKESGGGAEITGDHYTKAGGVVGALNLHAKRIYDGLSSDQLRAWTEKVFRCLTVVESGRLVRRPARLDRIYEVVGAKSGEDRLQVNQVIEAYSAPENSLLLISGGTLRNDAVVDISHESLIRRWEKLLQEWIPRETESVSWYRDITRAVELRRRGEGGLWRDPALERALRRKTNDGWNEAWAVQYFNPKSDQTVAFKDVVSFIEASTLAQDAERAREEEERRKDIEQAHALARAERRAKHGYRLATAVLIILGAASLLYFVNYFRKEAELRQQRETSEKAILELNAKLASSQQEVDHLNDLKYQAETALAEAKTKGANQTEIAKLSAQLKDANARLAVAQSANKNVEQQAQQTTSNTGDAYAKEIAELQRQIQELRTERDAAVEKLRATGYKGK